MAAEREMQKESERRHEKVVRHNEKAKEVSLAVFKARSSGSSSRSDSCTSKDTIDGKPEFHSRSEHCLL